MSHQRLRDADGNALYSRAEYARIEELINRGTFIDPEGIVKNQEGQQEKIDPRSQNVPFRQENGVATNWARDTREGQEGPPRARQGYSRQLIAHTTGFMPNESQNDLPRSIMEMLVAKYRLRRHLSSKEKEAPEWFVKDVIFKERKFRRDWCERFQRETGKACPHDTGEKEFGETTRLPPPYERYPPRYGAEGPMTSSVHVSNTKKTTRRLQRSNSFKSISSSASANTLYKNADECWDLSPEQEIEFQLEGIKIQREKQEEEIRRLNKRLQDIRDQEEKRKEMPRINSPKPSMESETCGMSDLLIDGSELITITQEDVVTTNSSETDGFGLFD